MKLTKYSVFFQKDLTFGNPAVVIETSLDKETVELQNIAKELNAPVTVFLSDKEIIPKVRFFYPNRETSICVHGALAVACYLLKETSSIKVMNIESKELLLSKEHERYFVNLTPIEINKEFNSNEVLRMLDLSSSDINPVLPFEVISTGSPKLLIPCKDLETIKNLKPKFDDISNWSQENSVNGFYVYTTETFDYKSNLHARNFNPISGQQEDVATGVAAAALAWRLFKNNNFQETYIIEQGHFLKKPCVLWVHVKDNYVKIGGNVAILTEIGAYNV